MNWQEEPSRREREPAEGKTTRLFLAIGVLVVLVIVTGVLWLTGAIRPGETNGTPAPYAARTTAPESDLVDRLPGLPGSPNPHSSTLGVREAAQLTLIGPHEAYFLSSHGVREVTWKGSAKDSINYVVLAAKNDNHASASATTAGVQEMTASYFDAREPISDRLWLYRKLDANANLFQVVYTSDTYTVRLGLAQVPGNDATGLRKQIKRIFDRVAQVLPPT